MTHSDLESRKIRVGIFFGGKSAEHNVSLQSAKNVLEALDTSKFEPVLIGIDKFGGWHIQDAAKILASKSTTPAALTNSASALTLLPGKGTIVDIVNKGKLEPIDVALPILHGPMGEDGTIQGFFELANIPYTGPGVLGSAVGMDKDIMKRLLRDAGIAVAPYRAFRAHQRAEISAEEIFKELGSPLFIKPANMGSSVGVGRAQTNEELEAAVAVAFTYDSKILIESAIEGDEIECAVLGNEHPTASVVGKIVPRKGDFYSYEAKYIDENGALLEIPAQLSAKTTEAAREIAVKVFEVLGCEGMGRVDMFATKDGSIVVNEINTIPGFTKISMYPKLWEASGLPYKDLITTLIELALQRRERQNKLRTE